MAEVSIVPRVKTETQTIQSPISKCGDNWWKDVRIRCPYKGTDVAFRTLPSLGEPSQIESFDLEFLDEMLGDHERIVLFVAEHLAEMTNAQRGNIEKMLARAAAYIADARQIWNFWSIGFTTPGSGQIPAWPLGGQPKGPINGNIDEGHQRDGEKWKRLIRAALRNIRCAEEVAKKATIRLRNQERHKQGRVFGVNGLAPTDDEGGGGGVTVKKMKFVPATPTPDPGEGESELEEGEIDLEEEPILEEDGPLFEEEPETIPETATDPALEPEVEEEFEEEFEEEVEEAPAPPAKKKKKDNTLLIAGAAALGVLALSKR